MKRKKGYDKSVYHSFTLVMQFGINILVPICMMTALGIFLDNKLGTSFWVIVLFFLGAIAGGQNVYRMAKKIGEQPSERAKQREQRSRNADNRSIEKEK